MLTFQRTNLMMLGVSAEGAWADQVPLDQAGRRQTSDRRGSWSMLQ